jgi:hypothetical protein
LQVLERVVEDISFHAPERAGDTYTVDKEVRYVVFIRPLWHVLCICLSSVLKVDC